MSDRMISFSRGCPEIHELKHPQPHNERRRRGLQFSAHHGPSVVTDGSEIFYYSRPHGHMRWVQIICLNTQFPKKCWQMIVKSHSYCQHLSNSSMF